MPTLSERLLGIKQQEALTKEQESQKILADQAARDAEYARLEALREPWRERVRTYLVPELETVKEIMGNGKGNIVTGANIDGGFASIYYNQRGYFDGSSNFDVIQLSLDGDENVLIANQGKKRDKEVRIGNIHDADIRQKIGDAISQTIDNGWQHGSYDATHFHE